MKIFVFGIGGTGARVIRSLTMLMASGVEMPTGTTIVPIIVDCDLQNADTQRTISILDTYKKVRYEAFNINQKDAEYRENSFFNTPLTRLSDLQNDDNKKIKIGKEFHVAVEGADKTFGNYIGYDSLLTNDTINLSLTKDFVASLYNDDTESIGRELHLKLDKGFKGNPNIGAVIFEKWTETNEFKFFEQCVEANDRIFIISSIFGGTGAAGFPKLVQAIKKSMRTETKNALLAASVVMPYFKFVDDASSAISESYFNSKTKAALNYYKTCRLNENFDALYYIGDKLDSTKGMYNNSEGGKSQKNDANYVELLAATAIVDFANKSERELKESIRKAKDFGFKHDISDANIDLRYFDGNSPDKGKFKFIDDLTRFAYFFRYFNEVLPKTSASASYVKVLGLESDMPKTTFYKELENFLNSTESPFYSFGIWLAELIGNPMRKFNCYNINFLKNETGEYKKNGDSKMNEMLVEHDLKNGFLKKHLTDNDFNTWMNKELDKKDGTAKSDKQISASIFMDIAYETMCEALKYALSTGKFNDFK